MHLEIGGDMGENDRELGEISAKLDIMAKAIDKLTDTLDKMQIEGCVIGKENASRIGALEATKNRIVFAVVAALVGGQAGVEFVKQILLP
jgi:hypothetical protein